MCILDVSLLAVYLPIDQSIVTNEAPSIIVAGSCNDIHTMVYDLSIMLDHAYTQHGDVNDLW
jgi:hypothetical protein